MKFILLICLWIVYLSSNAQTKKETIDWLNSKLSDYITKNDVFEDCSRSGCEKTRYTSVKIISNSIGEYIFIEHYCPEKECYNPKFKTDIVYLTNVTRTSFCDDPINKIEFCATYSQPAFVLHVKPNRLFRNDEIYSHNKTYFPIDFSAEENLRERFKKAFDHLLSFYQTKDKEPF